MKKYKLKYLCATPEGIKDQSIMCVVRENDIIEVNETDYKRLILKRHNGKPKYELVKENKKQEEKAEAKK